jgi:polycomb group RING finger protein 6
MYEIFILNQLFLFGYKIAIPQPVPSSKGRAKKVLESVFRIPPELDMSLLLEFIG